MSRKSISLGIGADRAKTRKTLRQAERREETSAERRTAHRSLLVLGAVVLAFCTVGTLAAWRGISSLNAARNATGANALTVPLPGATPPNLPANAPAKEFIYAGSALLATSEAFRQPPSDIAVWRPGANGGSSTWYILNAQQQPLSPYTFGVGTDIPITRDFDGDGKTDFCVFRPSNGTWYSIGSLNNANNTLTSLPFGQSGDKPESADFDGDGKSDLAVWRDSAAAFYIKRSTDNVVSGYSIGLSGDKPVIGDYDGDGRADYATWRAGDGIWRILKSSTNTLYSSPQWGVSGDIPVPGNFSDGDTVTDLAVWRPSNGTWYIKPSDGSTRQPVQWGQGGDIPVPAPFKR